MRDSITPVAAVVLAAGGGRRMGRPKGSLHVSGARLVDHHVRALAPWVDEVVVVVGAERVDVPGARAVTNPLWATGWPADSLRCALGTLPPGPVLVAPVDSSPVRAVTAAALARATGSAVPVGPNGVGGHPVRLSAEAADAVRRAAPDGGLRVLLAAAPRLITSDPWLTVDLDTPEDWRTWSAVWTPEVDATRWVR